MIASGTVVRIHCPPLHPVQPISPCLKPVFAAWGPLRHLEPVSLHNDVPPLPLLNGYPQSISHCNWKTVRCHQVPHQREEASWHLAHLPKSPQFYHIARVDTRCVYLVAQKGQRPIQRHVLHWMRGGQFTALDAVDIVKWFAIGMTGRHLQRCARRHRCVRGQDVPAGLLARRIDPTLPTV